MELMRNTNMSIGEVASMVGYPNQLYFSKVFRKYQGLPPSGMAPGGSHGPGEKTERRAKPAQGAQGP